MKKLKTIALLLIPLALNACGLSVYAKMESLSVNDESDTGVPTSFIEVDDFLLLNFHSSNPNKYENKSNKRYKDTIINIQVQDGEAGKGYAVGAFPLIPIPPYIPTAILSIPSESKLCESNDGNLAIEISYKNPDNIISKFDPDRTFLIDPNKNTIRSTNYTLISKEIKEDYSVNHLTHRMHFPIKCNKADEYILVINSLYDRNNKRIHISRKKLHHQKSYIMGLGYFTNN